MNLHSKKDFQDCMLSILEPLKPYYSEEKARLTLGVTMAHYDIGATWMEAFSRPLWGLVPFGQAVEKSRNSKRSIARA